MSTGDKTDGSQASRATCGEPEEFGGVWRKSCPWFLVECTAEIPLLLRVLADQDVCILCTLGSCTREVGTLR